VFPAIGKTVNPSRFMGLASTGQSDVTATPLGQPPVAAAQPERNKAMTTNREARQGVLLARMREIEGQHREAVETGDKTQAEAHYAQGMALCEEAVREEREAIARMTELATAKATLYELNLKGSLRRMAAVRDGGEA
jgi:hypothetical protein